MFLFLTTNDGANVFIMSERLAGITLDQYNTLKVKLNNNNNNMSNTNTINVPSLVTISRSRNWMCMGSNRIDTIEATETLQITIIQIKCRETQQELAGIVHAHGLLLFENNFKNIYNTRNFDLLFVFNQVFSDSHNESHDVNMIV